MKQKLRLTMSMLICMLFGMGTAYAADQWVKTAPKDLSTGDVVVIVDQTSSTAMSNNNGTGSAPSATTVSLSTDKSEITSEISSTLEWTVTIETDANGTRTYQFGTGTKHLYTTDTNNGVRVGTNEDNTFTIFDNEGVNFLVNSATKRYIGVYNSQDWRCYTSINANIKNCETAFYKKVSSSSSATATTTTIDASGIANTDVYIGTAAGTLSATVKAGETTIKGATVTWTSSNDNVATVDANGAVTLVAAGTTTITASYAGVEEEYRASEATYELTVTNSDPDLPGTANNPYTVAQARAAIDAGTGVTGVYATGIVSQVLTYNSSNGYINYYISTDGTTTSDQLEAYKGKSYDGANFTSEDDIQVGDKVVIYGNLTKYGTDTYEFAADNKLVSLVRPVNPAVETATTIDATGITNTDVYTSTAAGTLTATVTANNQAIADAIVTWTSSNENVATVDANGAVTLVAAGTTTITASYAGVEEEYRASEATYELTVTNSDPNLPGAANNPYTVEQAIRAIDSGTGTTGVYVKGIVSTIVTPYSSQYGNISYKISYNGSLNVGQILAYRGKSYNGDNFTSEDDIQIGDEVVIYGNLTLHGTDTYEFAANNQLVSLVRKEVPVVELTAVSEKMWDFADWTTTSFEATTIVDNMQVAAASDATVTIDGSNKSLDDYNFTKRLKLGGTGSASSRNVHFIVAGNSKITVYGMTSSSNNERTLNIDKGTFGNTVATLVHSGSDLGKVVYNHVGTENADIYIYSAGSGFNIYGIKVEPLAGPADPTVSFAQESVTVRVGETTTNAISKPEDLTVTYSSSNPEFATVDGEGIVTGVAVGTTTITASWNAVESLYNAGSKTYTVNVIDASIPITIGEGFETQEASSTYNTTKTYTANESDCGIGWTMYYGTVSTNDKIAGNNSAQMRYYSSATDNRPYIQTTTPIEDLSSISFKARVSSTDLIFYVSGSADGTNWTDIATGLSLKTAGSGGVTTFSYDDLSGYKYIKIGVAANSAAPTSGNWKLIIDEVQFTSAPASDEPVDPTVTFEATDVTVNVGETVTNAISGPSSLTYTYTTGDQAIATVNEEGVVTGVAIGTTTITAAWEATNKYNAGSVSYNVTVENKKEATATISAMNLEVGGAAETITTNPESLAVTYSTSDEAIATVSETGEVSGVAAGKATITVSWEEQVIEGVTYIAGRETFNVTVITPIQCVFEENYYTRFDFTQNGWGLPEGNTNKTVEENNFKNTGKTIKLAGSRGNGYYFNAQGYLVLGKEGAYLELPAFDFDVAAIEVVGNSIASGKVTQNIYVDETAVSTETTGATDTNIYFIDKNYQAAGNTYTIKVTNDYNSQITEIKVYKKDAFVEFAVTDAGYRTYCNAEGLDFSVATEGLTAYIIEGVDAEGSTNLVTKEVTNVPAYTGLLIQAEAGTYYVAKSEATATTDATSEAPVIITDDVKNNQLVGVVEATEIDPSIIVLMNGNEGVGFYKTSKPFTVGANTAYLPVSVLETVATASADSGVKTLSIFGTDDDTPTGINGIAADKLENAAIYNLSGQRVARPEKGIYIINGKKVLVK